MAKVSWITPDVGPVLAASGQDPDEVAEMAGLGWLQELTSSSRGHPRGRRILVVDDDEPTLAALERTLEAMGHRVETARDGLQALERLDGQVDLLIVDALMPRLHGLELTRRVRSDEHLSELPVLMVSALAGPADRMRALEAGVDDFLGKPMSRVELQARVTTLLRLRESREGLRLCRAEMEEIFRRRTEALRRERDDLEEAYRDLVEENRRLRQQLSAAS